MLARQIQAAEPRFGPWGFRYARAGQQARFADIVLTFSYLKKQPQGRIVG
jgi:hypothetical protein